jgi:hypothetical protein
MPFFLAITASLNALRKLLIKGVRVLLILLGFDWLIYS